MEPLLGQSSEKWFEYNYLISNAYMYQGKLKEAMHYAEKARRYAKGEDASYLQFQVDLLQTQIQMSGWCNIFFCAQDIEIGDSLLERLHMYNYRNHLFLLLLYGQNGGNYDSFYL